MTVYVPSAEASTGAGAEPAAQTATVCMHDTRLKSRHALLQIIRNEFAIVRLIDVVRRVIGVSLSGSRRILLPVIAVVLIDGRESIGFLHECTILGAQILLEIEVVRETRLTSKSSLGRREETKLLSPVTKVLR